MSKIKLTIGLFVFLLIGLFSSRLAYASYVSITQLPGYINYTDFKISCSSLGGTTAQFSSRKDGSSYTDFGSLIDLTTSPCQVQVNGTQFGSEGKFWFKVTLNDGTFAETSTTLDTSGTSPVTDFGKERMNSNTMYKVHWKNPLESDFIKVFIYRGEVAGFEADDAHKVAEMGGNPGDTMFWDNGGLDPNKEYYYVIRALDHANNSSSLVGDAGVTTTSTTTGTSGTVLGSSTGGTGSGKVTQLPKEEVLGGESGVFTPAPEAATDVTNTAETLGGGLLNWILTHKAITLGVILALGLLWYFLRRRSK